MQARLRAPRVARLLREIAEKQEIDADRIATTMFAAYREEIPSYAEITDPALTADVQAVSAALVRLWLHFMVTQHPLTAEAAAPLRQGARRRAAQGMDLHSLLRAYRVGIRVMWRELVSAPEWQSPTLRGAALDVAERALDFADRISNEVVAAYVDEAALAAREREHRRSALLNVILAGPGGDVIRGPAQLDGAHVVVVAHITEELELDRLEAIGLLLEAKVGAVIWTVRHHSVIAAVPVRKGRDRDDVVRRLGTLSVTEGIVAIGVGGHARGPAETRQSYSEAADALRIGRALRADDHPVLDFLEFAPLVALLRRPEEAHRFVADTLEPLSRLDDRPWALPTVEAYIARQGRTKEVAHQLGVHLNTVKYRMREIREAAGSLHLEGDRSGTLLLALRLRRLLENADS